MDIRFNFFRQLSKSKHVKFISLLLIIMGLSLMFSYKHVTAGEDDEKGIKLENVTPGATLRATLNKKKSDPLMLIDLLRPCKALSGTLNLGSGNFSVQISISEEIKPFTPDEDPNPIEGMCHYRAIGVAGIQIRTGDIPGGDGAFSVPIGLPDCDIDVYTPEGSDHDDPKSYRSVSLYWSGDERDKYVLFDRFGVFFKVYSMSMTLNTNRQTGALSLSQTAIEVQMDADSDVHLSGPVYLSGDLSSIIEYRWNDGAQSWTDGNWLFNGLSGVELQIRRGGTVPIAIVRMDLNEQGEGGAMFEATSQNEWTVNGFTMKIAHCSLAAQFSLKDGSWEITDGSIEGSLTASNPLEGEFDYALAWENQIFNMSIRNSSKIKLFGGSFDNTDLNVTLNPNLLEIKRIEGSLNFQHSSFDTPILIQEFLVQDGVLKAFTGACRVGYKGFKLDISEISYNSNDKPSQLSISATLDLKWSKGVTGSVAVRNFTIDAEGDVSQIGINANINSSPINITFDATLNQDEFSGEFRGNLGGIIPISGTTVIGTQTTPQKFNYGAFIISSNIRRGIPIGYTGLQVLGLNGGFGLNYLPKDAPPIRLDDGSMAYGPKPVYEIYYLAAKITIGDMAGLASLNGTIQLVLGSNSVIGISGIGGFP